MHFNPGTNTDSNNPLVRALASLKPVFGYLILFSFISNVFMLAIPLYSLQVLDRVIASGSMETLFWLTVITLSIMAAVTVIQLARSAVMQKMYLWLDFTLQEQLVKRTIRLSAAFANAQGSTQMLRDFQTVKSFVTGGFATILLDAPWSALYFLAVMMIHPMIGAVTLVGSVILIAFAWFNEKTMRVPLANANALSLTSMQALESAARNAEAINAMGMTDAVTARLRKKSDVAMQWQMLANSRSAVVQGTSRFARVALQIMVTCTGAYLATHQEITTGAIIASSILANKAMAPFENIIAMWKTASDARIALQRLKSALDILPSPDDECITLPEPLGQIDVENLSFSVPGKAILRNISFSLKPGEALGIVGPSAAGKSTLARLTAGVMPPQAGSVRMDGAEMHHWRREQALEYIGYLPQDIELFDGSVRDNIARMREDADDAAVIAAAKMVGLHEMILQLPQGYATDIGPGGLYLSQGQRQRIGLARAFYGNPRLVVLDEPNANLDQEGELALLATLKRARGSGITTVTVTHSMAVLMNVTTVLLLNQGMVARIAPAQEILGRMQIPVTPQKSAA